MQTHVVALTFLALPLQVRAEYCAQGSLYDALKQAANGGAIYEQLTWTRRLSLVSRDCTPAHAQLWSCGWPPTLPSRFTHFVCPAGLALHTACSAPSLLCPAPQLWGTAKGMAALHGHSPPIIHRDLRSPNILISTPWVAKVS